MKRIGIALVLVACGSSGSNPDGGVGNDAATDAQTSDVQTTDVLPADDGGMGLKRPYPDTNATIALLVDQLPTMNAAQMVFATKHYVGTEKQLLSVTQQLRALNPNFLVLHYHLALWQSAPTTDFIIDGKTWGNDYSTVTQNETWFWHNTQNQRVMSSADQKLLMNLGEPAFAQYWESSLETQVGDGDYDGIMFDSASPALLQGECGGNGANQDARLAGTAAHDTSFTELGGKTWVQSYGTFMSQLDAQLAAKGIMLIPNTSAFVTGWDTTDYTVTHGIFSEGFADRNWAVSDWTASTNYMLKLASLDKIMILQNYLSSASDVATRMYYLGNYLLVKGHHTYLDYFAQGALEWYPEWGVDLGTPASAPTTDVSTLKSGAIYRRDFTGGSVLVNPTSAPVNVTISGNLVVPNGGGTVDASASTPGSFTTQPVTQVNVGATTAAIVLK